MSDSEKSVGSALTPLSCCTPLSSCDSFETEESIIKTDSDDIVEVFIPEKYRENCVIAMNEHENFLLNFYCHFNDIREQNLSFRDITLNHIQVLEIRYAGKEKIKLCLNLGLNPFLRLNDYYISNLNSEYKKSPILVFKRFKTFNPHCDDELSKENYTTEMRVRRSDIVDIEKMHRNFDISTDIDTGSVIIENFDRDYMKGNGYGVWNIDGTMFLDKGVMYRHNQELDSLTKDSINATTLLNTEPDPDKMSLYEFHNACMWKYGSLEYPTNGDAFEWFKGMGSKTYELVRSFPRISEEDFLSAMRVDYDNLDKQEAKKRKCLESLGYNDIMDRMIEKMKTIGETSLCREETIKEGMEITLGKTIPMSPLRLLINDYIMRVQKYIFEGDHTEIMKYINKKKWSFTIFENDTLYQEILNDNLFCILEDGLEDYSTEVINNEQYELQSPDIYILLGFRVFPCFFTREVWRNNDFANELKWKYLIKCIDFLETTWWYYMYGLCCFFAQVIGPSYYVYNYYLIDNNNFCPNNSSTLNKFFAVAYYLVLYARMNSFWESLTESISQYGYTTMITNDNYLRLSMIINTICLYIVPIFTYTLFIELSNVTDLILNCLTGEFLINIDNLIVDFIGVEDYVKALTKDLLVYSFLKTGYPSKNIMEGNTLDLWLITLVQIIQMFGTLCMTGIVYACI